MVLIALLSNGAMGLYRFHRYDAQLEDAENQTRLFLNKLQLSLDELSAVTVSELHALSEPLANSNGNLESIERILRKQINKGKGLVRFAWVDNVGQMRVSSVAGILDPPQDVSRRDYLAQTKQQLGKIVVSRQISHILYKEPVIIFALGVQNTSGRYLGTLNAAINHAPLRDHIGHIMQLCACHYAVYSPHGETVVTHNYHHPLETAPRVNHFRVEGETAPDHLRAMRHHNLQHSAFLLTLLNGLLAGLWYYLRRYILMPVAHAMTQIDGELHPPILMPFEARLAQIAALGDAYRDVHSQLQQANQMISDMQTQQKQFFAASGMQMHEAFRAIHHYAEHLEELVLSRELQSDAPYDFDDVAEMGENLQQLSEGFQLLCQWRDGQKILHPSSLTVSRLLSQCLQRCQPMIERRNLALMPLPPVSTIPDVIADETLMRRVITSCLHTLFRHSEDESQITITHEIYTDYYQLSLACSHFRQSSLPTELQNFGMFMPSLSRDWQAAMQAHLRHHANLLMAESFLAACGGKIEVLPNGQAGFMLIITMDTTPFVAL